MANAFETEVQQAAVHLGLGHWKLNVGPGAGKMVRRFTRTAPYDCFLLSEGRHIALELKSQEAHGSFAWPRVKEHQVLGLREAARHGCPSYLLVNMRRRKKGTGKEARLVSDNQSWLLRIQDWDALLASLPPGPGGRERKSVPLDLVQHGAFFHELPRIPVRSEHNGERVLVWDLRVLLPGGSSCPDV